MPFDPAATLSRLLRAATIEDHVELLEAANNAIRSDKNDLLARHTKVVALLKLDRFGDAVRFIDDSGDELESLCRLEKAYALYKCGNLDEATLALKSVTVRGRGFEHLAAQIAYRAERPSEASEIYLALLRRDANEEESDVRINNEAVQAQHEWTGSTEAASNIAEHHKGSYDSFEFCYNAACVRVARGEYDNATELLQRAAVLCKASEDLKEEDKEAELRSIWVQQSYVFAYQGKTKEALEVFKSLGSIEDADADLAVVAKNNLAMLQSSTQNPYIAQRMTESILSVGASVKLFDYQYRRLVNNVYVTDLNAQKASGIRARTHKMLTQAPQPTTKYHDNSVSLFHAAASTKDLTVPAAIREMQKAEQKRPHDVGIVLALIQLQLQRKRAGAALTTLERFFERIVSLGTEEASDVRFNPGLVAIAVRLMHIKGRKIAAKHELVKAATYWTSRPNSNAQSLLREAGIELMRCSDPADLELAGSAFTKILTETPTSQVASAGVVASLAAVDRVEFREHVAKLPQVGSLISGVDTHTLLQVGVVSKPASILIKKRAAAKDLEQRLAKKQRRPRIPKNMVAGNTPDPERWLPLRDRSSYRPKHKKGKKKATESTQGGLVREEETLELVGGGGVKVERATSSGTSKKKKKGKK